MVSDQELPAPASGQRMSGEQRQQAAAVLAERYQAGASIRELAATAGYSIGRVRGLLIAAGVEFRSRGGRPAPR